MKTMRDNVRDADGSRLDGLSIDALLLAEANHRVLNELASAIASLRLCRSASGPSGARLVADAIERLEGFAELHRIVGATRFGEVELSSLVESACRAVFAGRPEARHAALTLDLSPAVVPAPIASSILMIVVELLINAVKHGLRSGGTGVFVQLLADEDGIGLMVADDGPGTGASLGGNGTGLGRDIVARLVKDAGGLVTVESGPAGTAVHVELPRRDGAGEARGPVPF